MVGFFLERPGIRLRFSLAMDNHCMRVRSKEPDYTEHILFQRRLIAHNKRFGIQSRGLIDRSTGVYFDAGEFFDYHARLLGILIELEAKFAAQGVLCSTP